MYQECHRGTLLPGWAWIPQDPTSPLRRFNPDLGWEHEQEDASWITEDTEGRETSNPCPLWDPTVACNYRTRFVEYSHFPPPSTFGGKYCFSLRFCCFQSPFVHSRPDTIEGGGSEFEDNLVYKVSLWGSQGFYAEKSPSTLIEHQGNLVS